MSFIDPGRGDDRTYPVIVWGQGQGLAIVPLTFFSSTPALLRYSFSGIRDQTAQVELKMVKGTMVSTRVLPPLPVQLFSSTGSIFE
jgi:hypothetical protein